ncbi:hypothetical protein PTB13_25135, partial [Bacillus sp. MHSD17]|nr:hypothetical protein [Bacillus sp. MHSD17]
QLLGSQNDMATIRLKNESLLEQVKEKERVIDEMYQEDCRKLAKVREKQEEKMLLDLKMCMNG